MTQFSLLLYSQSSTTQSTYGNNRPPSTTENKVPKTDVNRTDNSIEKCPVCYMIFPSNMSETARLMHVDEHLSNQ